MKDMDGFDDDIWGTFYYDETNIFHKLLVTEKGSNNDIFKRSFFGLGGIFIDKKNIDFRTDDLLLVLKPQKTMKEFKYKYFSNNNTDALKALNSKRFLTLFKWLKKHDVLIHFTLMDYLYFGIADIVDSLPDARNTGDFNRELKSVLYDVVRDQLNKFLKLFYKYNYPNIDRSNIKDFVNDFYNIYLNIVEYDNYNSDDFPKELLRQMIKTAKKSNELSFLHNNESLELFSKYSNLYIDRPVKFPNSKHIFDEVYEVQKELVALDTGFESKLNMNFLNSKSLICIQISDAIIGLISRLTNLILNLKDDEVRAFVLSLNDTQIEVLTLLYDRMNSGTKKSVFFNQVIASNSLLRKQQKFINLIYLRLKKSD